MAIKLEDLTRAVAGGAAAIRAVTRLEPPAVPETRCFRRRT